MIRPASFARAAGMILLVIVASPVAAQEADRIDPSKPIPSTGMLLSKHLQGSGFLVDRDNRLLLTNHHVVQTGQEIDVVFPIWTEAGQILTNRDLYLTKAKRIRGKCLASTSQRDLAVVQLQSVPLTVPEIKLAGAGAKVGDKGHLLGNPGQSKQVWIFGFGRVEKVGLFDHSFGPGNHVQLQSVVLTTDDRKIGPGASGGPVVNDNGELLGVIESGPGDRHYVTCVALSEVRVFLGGVYRKYGSAAIAQKEYGQAVARLNRAVDVNPRDPLSFHERAVAYSFQQRYEEAIRDYTAAVKLDPQSAYSFRGRASAYARRGDYARAVDDCNAAIKIDPKYAQAYLTRSLSLEKLGRAAEARTDYAMAVKLDPTLK